MTPRQPWEQVGALRRDCAPHRAHLLLRVGSVAFLLSLLSPLAVPGVVAIALGAAVHEMGKRDLARMAAGRMDPAGAADTRLAMRRGEVGTVLGFCGVLGCAPVCLPSSAPSSGDPAIRTKERREFPPAASH
jgi:hypothetical protein